MRSPRSYHVNKDMLNSMIEEEDSDAPVALSDSSTENQDDEAPKQQFYINVG